MRLFLAKHDVEDALGDWMNERNMQSKGLQRCRSDNKSRARSCVGSEDIQAVGTALIAKIHEKARQIVRESVTHGRGRANQADVRKASIMIEIR